jgi:N-methylhydantoinase A
VALVTTRGFRDLLEIGRQTRPHMYDFNRDFPQPLVPRALRFEVRERIAADGRALVDIDEAEVVQAVEAVKAAGVEACAICFLFAFLNPAHEERMAAALRDALPGLHLSLSSAVQPEFREFERFNTTVINAYLQPVMNRYMADLETGLGRLVPGSGVGINQSSGGLMTPGRARDVPVRTALSGPAAGVVGALSVAKSADRRNVITLDVGGTSADVALIRDLRAEVSFDQSVAEFPIRLPMVDIHTIGAGGGSIAWFDRDGLLKVGPASAGAVPGPACYGLGGTEPTVSDANLLLGRLSPRLIGGAMTLDLGLAETAIGRVAERLGLALERTAHGIVGIAVANMVRAIRTVSVERGHDPRDFSLMPFGGAGPLHAHEVAVSLGIGEIIIPQAPGIVCAQGLVVSDLKEDFVISHPVRLDAAATAGLRVQAEALLDQAQRWFAAEGAGAEGRTLELSLDARHVGQNYELAVPVATGPALTPEAVPDVDALCQRFFQVHETSYGYFNAHDPIEVINVRLTARATLYRANGTNGANGQMMPEADAGAGSHRPVFFDAEAAVDTPVYARAQLSPGQTVEGPAIVEQLDTTIPIYPGDRARVDAAGTLLIELAP